MKSMDRLARSLWSCPVFLSCIGKVSNPPVLLARSWTEVLSIAEVPSMAARPKRERYSISKGRRTGFSGAIVTSSKRERATLYSSLRTKLDRSRKEQ
jgi:hypothetical protein